MGCRQQYRSDLIGLQVQMYQLSRLLRDKLKRLHDHFEDNEVTPQLFAAPWFLTLFASQFSLTFVSRVFGESDASLQQSQHHLEVRVRWLELERGNLKQLVSLLAQNVPSHTLSSIPANLQRFLPSEPEKKEEAKKSTENKEKDQAKESDDITSSLPSQSHHQQNQSGQRSVTMDYADTTPFQHLTLPSLTCYSSPEWPGDGGQNQHREGEHSREGRRDHYTGWQVQCDEEGLQPSSPQFGPKFLTPTISKACGCYLLTTANSVCFIAVQI
ncbi:TBC1 domain family member 4 [Portunus trituberculatus]|uniref:TBC1 domain family member 4 n=1 Tax=Portunus trituberculatus TaxID=210409 RepID=A0A5B7DFS1_PORTR|nr:TBC1 domain family member 4 [Portunus trituberculatus]